MLKDQLFKPSRFRFDNWLFGTEKSSGLSRNRPLDLFDAGEVLKQLSYQANGELVVMWVDNVLVDIGYISIYGVDS